MGRLRSAWDAVRDRIGFLVLPGVAFAAGLLTLWASLLGELAIEKWQREHLSREFRRAFVEE